MTRAYLEAACGRIRSEVALGNVEWRRENCRGPSPWSGAAVAERVRAWPDCYHHAGGMEPAAVEMSTGVCRKLPFKLLRGRQTNSMSSSTPYFPISNIDATRHNTMRISPHSVPLDHGLDPGQERLDPGSQHTSRLNETPVENFRPMRVIVIGAGYSGIYCGIRIPERLRNVDLCIYDKNAGVGGTWYENR